MDEGQLNTAAMSLAALTLTQLMMREVLTRDVAGKVLDDALAFLERPAPDGSFAEVNERAALIVRDIFRRQ